MQQYDYRIKRNDDKKKTIGDCLKDDASLTEIFDDFRHAWGNEFTNETNLSMFLLNKSNENETMKITNCLNRLVNLQNEIIDYFYLNILNYVGEHRVVPMQSIQKRHLFDFDTNKLRQVLWEKGLLINDEYGMSEEIIYDFDEIEWILRNEVSCLPKIDVKNMRYFHYQGDLYDETMSLINDIRSQLEQKLFDPSERKEIKQVIENLDKNLLLELFDLMEYILFYLRNLNNQTILQTFTLQTFIQQYVHLKAINENKLLNKKPLSSIHLNYIIDFYELIEQCLFDKILSHNIRTEFNEDSFSDQQRNEILDQFCRQTIDNEQTVNCFKDLNNWIDMFKRLLVRVLLPKKNINFDSPLHDYVKWTDMWKGNISPENIRTIEINRNICLKHSFIILKGLELKNLPQVTSDDESMPQSTKPSQRSKNVSQRGGRAIPKTVLRD